MAAVATKPQTTAITARSSAGTERRREMLHNAQAFLSAYVRRLRTVLQMVIPDYCKDLVHPDHPTAGWLRRKKRDKRALTGSFVRRFFRLECDTAVMRYSFCYGKKFAAILLSTLKMYHNKTHHVFYSNCMSM